LPFIAFSCDFWYNVFRNLSEVKGSFFLTPRKEYSNGVNILVEDRQNAYGKVNELLHSFADIIKLRVGYPIPEENFAIITLIVKTTNDNFGSLTGRIGQIKGVKVKSIPVR